MKFDFVIGNPPYHVESFGDKISDKPIYNYFMDAAYQIADVVEVITPARFLFNNGNTPKEWNEKMLNDTHMKVLNYEIDSKKIFQNTDIKGGVAITYRDKTKEYKPIVCFTPYNELNTILEKVNKTNENSITKIIYNQNCFNLEILYQDYPELKKIISSEGKERRLTSGCMSYECFKDNEQKDYIEICGLEKNKRCRRYIDKKYLDMEHENIFKYKVILPANNGSGAIGEVLSTPLIGEPLIGEPLIGFTQTFISIGAFDNIVEANSCMKYVKSKFARTMLGILKITQNGKREVWKHVPIQDFTNKSDIDWSKAIKEIDQQLYKKYNLTKEEIDFIETKVKEME